MDVPEADAEEIASDVLFTVTRKIHTFKCGGRAKLTTWIYEIAKNRAIDFHRKTRVEEVEFDDNTRGGQKRRIVRLPQSKHAFMACRRAQALFGC